MPPPSPAVGSVRSAAVINEEIRALWQRAGGMLSPAERQAYERLVVEWATAMRTEITAAA